MDQTQAAKYLIVGWIKNWNLSTYLKTITGLAAPDYNNAYEIYPWLPTGRVPFYKKEIKRHIADNMPVLNNKLWDAKTDLERLSLYKFVLNANVGQNNKTHFDKARAELIKSNNDSERSRLADRLSVDEMRRGNGSHWNVVK